jgi:hypothetical protein
MSEPIRFVVVKIHTSPWEAHVSRALLESEGIPAFLANEHVIWASWRMSLALGGVRVLVPVDHAEAAINVFKNRDAGELQATLLAQEPFGQPVCLQCGSGQLVTARNWLSVTVAALFVFVWAIVFPPTKETRCAACGSLKIGEA